MSEVETSAEAVERLARAMKARVIETYGGHGTVLEMADDGCNAAAATLRALLSERDAARAEAERLRAALRVCVKAHQSGRYDAAWDAYEIARAALRENSHD